MLTAAFEHQPAFPGCARAEVRVNMFVLAQLATDGACNPVKIRNMSPSGAMVEGADLPMRDANCRLVRTDKAIDARVAWVAGGKAGLQFDRTIMVAEWLPAGQRLQHDVDATIVQARGEMAAGTLAPQAPSPAAPAKPAALAIAEVLQVADALEDLADALSDDPDVLARYMTKLQSLDLAVQTLRKLAPLAPGAS